MSALDKDIKYGEEDCPEFSLKHVLKIFGFDELWPKQQECIESIVKNRDVFISLPAASGKSFCFQSAGLMTPGLTLVVCHAKNLIYDQVNGLKNLGIKAEYILDWNTNGENNQRVIKDLRTANPETKFLYVCPERLETPQFKEDFAILTREKKLARIVIDEVLHLFDCEDSFRTAFENLLNVREILPLVPIIALTGACHPKDRKKVIRDLCMNDPIIIWKHLSRPNIRYIVDSYSCFSEDTSLQSYVENVLKMNKCPSALVYCWRQTDCDNLVKFLNDKGWKAAAIHGDTNDADRIEFQKLWKFTNKEVLCVTAASFGTINHPSVGFILHVNVPQSIEHYQLQTNQAGRNGSQAVSVILYDSQDPFRQSWCNESDEKLNVSKLIDFCRTKSCRREKLMELYAYSAPLEKCKGNALCDNCQNEDR